MPELTDEEKRQIADYIAAGVCPWHPIHELPCPVCYLRSFDIYATKAGYNPRPGRGLNNPEEKGGE